MTSIKRVYKWSPKIQEDLQKIANSISDSIELAVPDFNLDFILTVDACLTGAGGVLYQVGKDGKRRIIGIFSKGLDETQMFWSIVEKEAFAVVIGIAKFRRYLEGKEFLLESDHKPIEYITLKMNESTVPKKIV